jgi:NADH:ubiquinone oxidoreductase subunit 3 (subunit A)
MQTFLFILIVLAAIGALVSVGRGVYYFLHAQHEEVRTGQPSESGLKQNKMMWRRVQFQAIAIVFVILFLLVARGHAG